MNKIYRVVFNHATQTWTAVAEFARAKGKSATVDQSAAAKTVVSAGKIGFTPKLLTLLLLSGLSLQSQASGFGQNQPIYSFTEAPTPQNPRGTLEAINVGVPESKNTSTGGYNSQTKKEDLYAQGMSGTQVGNQKAVVSGYGGTAYGSQATATGYGSTAIGAAARALKSSSLALGQSAYANGDWSTSIGRQATTTEANTIAVGTASSAVAKSAISVGLSARAAGERAIAIGAKEATDTKTANRYDPDTNTQAFGEDSIALGTKARTNKAAKDGIAIGHDTEVEAEKGIAVGTNTLVKGAGSGAFGSTLQTNPQQKNIVEGQGSFSIGNNNSVTANSTVVLGSNINTENVSENSVFLGDGSSSDGDKSTVNSSTVSIDNQKNITFNNYAGTTPTGIVTVGSKGHERRIQNVAAGNVSQTSTDAINGSQLYSTNQALGKAAGSIATHLGGNSSVNADGSLTAPTYSLVEGKPSENKKKNYNNVGAALQALNSALEQSLTFQGNEGGNITKKLGDTLTIKGGATTQGNFSSKNTKVVVNGANGNKTLEVQIAENPEFNELKTNKLTVEKTSTFKGKITAQDGINITKGNLEVQNGVTVKMGNNKITEVADGKNTNDAVNFGQLTQVENKAKEAKTAADKAKEAADAAKNKAEQGFNLTANGQNQSTVKPGNTVNIKNGNNISVTKNTNNHEITIATSDAPSFTTITTTNGATIGGKLAANGGLDVKGGNIDMNNGKITKLQAGTDTTDAVNKGQLDTVDNKAQQAQRDATAAGKKADQASATAEQAKKQADDAVQKANEADTKADAAKKDAGEAKKDAGVAKKVADEAKNTAQNATNTANTAKDTADNALAEAQKGTKYQGDDKQTLTRKLGETLNIKGGQTNTDKLSENNIGVVKGQDDSTLNVKLAKDIQGLDSVTTGTLTATGAITQGPNDKRIVIDNGKITGLSETPTVDDDAANKKYVDDQNNKQNEGLKDLVGGNALVKDGKVTASDIGGTGKKTISEAIEAVRTTANSSASQFKGDNDTIVQPQNGVLNVKGGVTDTNKLSANNIGVIGDTNGTLTVKLAKELSDLDKVTVGTDQNKIELDGATGSVSAKNVTTKDLQATGDTTLGGQDKNLTVQKGTTINMGNNKITQVEDGTEAKDAVNFGQLTEVDNKAKTAQTTADNALAKANEGFKLQANGKNESTVTPGSTVDFKNGKNIQVTKDGNNITIATSDTPEFTSITTTNGATIGGKLTANQGLDVNGGNIAMNDGKITGLKAGEEDADAVNKGQLDGVKTDLETQLTNKTTEITNTLTNKGTKYQGDDNQTLSLRLGETLNIKGGVATNDLTTVDNIGVVKGQDDSTLNVKLAKDLKGLESVTTGTLTATGAITQGTNGAQIVINNGKITGLSATPTDNADAANKKYVDDQNNTQNDGVKDLVGGNALVKDGKVTATDIGGTGQNTIHEAINSVRTTANSSAREFKGDNDTIVQPQNGVLNVKGGVTDTNKLSANNIGVIGDANGTLTVKLAKELSDLDSVTVANTITAGTGENQVQLDGKTGAVTAKNITATETVKGKNLVATEKVTVGTNGNQIDLDGTTGKVTTKDLTVSGDTTLGGQGKNLTVQKGTTINMGGNKITEVADGTEANDAVNKGQLDGVKTDLETQLTDKATEITNALTNKGLNFGANEGEIVHRELGETLNIKGALANDVAASSENIRTKTHTDGTIEILIADKPKFTSIETDTLKVKGNAEIDGNQTVGGNQTVRGNQEVDGNSHIKGDQAVDGNLNVKGNADIQGSQRVGG
ncbi:ESPR-type extended signal peptide-containing protein, partial [[Pasteurella] aerogenes]